MSWAYLSSEKMTVAVELDQNRIIVDAPPIARKFIGQPLVNLIVWMGKHHPLRAVSYQ